jgi:Flp pilus assembly protein TadD
VRYRLVAARGFAATGSSIGLDRAIDQLDHALAVSPDDPVVGGERARLLLERARRSGNRAHARTALLALESLVTGDPRNPTVLLRLGIARAATGDAAGAERAWLAAERLAPRSPAASTDLALAYGQAGRMAEAGAAARRALARHATGPQVAQLRRLAGT